MNFISILLAVISLLVLAIGVYVWKLTSSRPTMINILASSAFLLIGGYAMTVPDRQKHEFGFALPFFAAMLCTGRAAAYLWRSRKEKELALPAKLMTGVSALTIVGTIAAFKAL